MQNPVQAAMRALFLMLALFSLVSPSHAAESRRDQLIKEELAREDAGDTAGAIKICEEILRIAPNDTPTLNTLAGLYGTIGKFEDEIVWAKKAISADATYHLAYVNYGNALISTGRMEEGRSAFEKAKSLAPRDPIPLYSLGVIAEKQRKFTEAINLYKKSVTLAPRFENGWYSLAATYANVKRYDDALATLDILLKLNPDAQDAKNMRREIEAEKGTGSTGR